MTKHPPRADMAQIDNPWDRAHTIPDFDTGPGWREWAAGAAIILALIGVGFCAGWFAHANAMEQVETCMEGCMK